MENRLNNIFEIISFYDNYRWANPVNYNLINFFSNDIDDDTKLLTHWLCYITDRQMAYKIVWNIGGFIISELITEVKIKKTIEILNPKEHDSFVTREDDENRYYLISKAQGLYMKQFEPASG